MNRSDILSKAKECVCGQRQTDYGKAEDNFQTIADLWTVYMDTKFTAKDVAVMMALMKIACIKTGTGTADCFIDLAGYAACGGEIATTGLKKTQLSEKDGLSAKLTQILNTNAESILQTNLREDNNNE